MIKPERTPVFDLFKIDIYGEPILLEAVQSLEAAMARVITLRESLPADYVVVSQITGKKYHSPRMVGYNEPERHTTQVSGVSELSKK